MPGYWDNREATSKTIVNGWLLTGDMGSIDEDGYITMHDRSKDMIISGGSNIYPREVEEILLLHETEVKLQLLEAKVTNGVKKSWRSLWQKRAIKFRHKFWTNIVLSTLPGLRGLKDISKSASYPRIIMGKF